MRALIHQSPTLHGHPRSRWTLALLLATCLALAGLSVSGAWRRLHAWHITRKRSRNYLTSPDPVYHMKCALIAAAQAQMREDPTQYVLLYGDEFTYYRNPAPGYAYHEQGAGGNHQPLAPLVRRSNTKRRLAGALDVHTGRVHWAQRATMGVEGLVKFLHHLRAAYPPEVTLTLVWDNWPIHMHPKVLAAAAEARIYLLWLPTYAPWLNPIEKLWNWLKAEVIQLHPWTDNWDRLHQQVAGFLNQFAVASPALLQYVGWTDEKQQEPRSLSP